MLVQHQSNDEKEIGSYSHKLVISFYVKTFRSNLQLFLNCVSHLISFSFSRAILQYIIDQHAKHTSLNPKSPKRCAIVNQRLFFDAATLFPRLRSYFVSAQYIIKFRWTSDANLLQAARYKTRLPAKSGQS